MIMSGGPFEIVADRSRRRLLDLMREGPLPVGELVQRSGLSQPNVSRHLRLMREAGLVHARAEGQRRLYGLRPDGFAEMARWLSPYVMMWQRSLGNLKAHLQADDHAR
jgi:DNA-binding transcriptional ArsR family regulator